MESNYEVLIRKIDEFTRKYYKNQLIRGLLYSMAALGTYFVLIVLLEFFSWFGTGTRSVLFYTFLAVALLILSRFILLPLFRLVKLGKVISHEQAAEMIGRHFAEVKDVLLNTLQLHQLGAHNVDNSDLISASIDQKITQLKPVPFTEAVDLKQNRRYLRYALPPVIFLLCALVISPSFILAPSKRIIHHNEVFERPAPFTIKILNDKLQAIQQDDFTVKVKIVGDEVPDQLYLKSGMANYRMEKESNILYSYIFRNLQQDSRFVISADQYNSKEYTIKILPKPIILSFNVLAEYPAYLGRKNELFDNTGDLTMPAGTRLTWNFFTRDTRNLFFRFGDKKSELHPGNSNAFTYKARVLTSVPYSVRMGNEFFVNSDSLSYQVNVIPDLYPSISVVEFKDSVFDNRLYFRGNISDDYGFNKLSFAWTVRKSGFEKPQTEAKTREISFDRSLIQQQFFYFMDMSTLLIEPGDVVEYYFEVADNDGVSGSKTTRSDSHIFKIPTLEEIEKMTEKKNDDIKDKMESVIKQSKTLQHKVEDMQRKMVDKNEIGWQEKQALKQLLDKQNELQQQVQEIQKENAAKNQKESQYTELSPEVVEKQKQLEELFNKVMTEDLIKMYDELQKMLDEVNKDKVADMLEKIKDDTRSIEKEIDRNLELFKQLELEQKMQSIINKTDKLAEDQEKLSKKTTDASRKDVETMRLQQEELNKQFDQLKDDINDMHKKNSELEEPNSLEKTDTEENAVDQEMDKSIQELNGNKPSKAAQSQKNASAKMKQLSEKLSQMQQEMQSEEQGEDMEAIRQILDNLVKISFDQEKLMNQLNVVSTTNPKYIQLIQAQKNLKEDLQAVGDSLYALSKRQAAIEPFILREMTAVANNMDEAVVQLNNRAISPARAKQQFAMTAVNNLALMLSESLKQMQQSMQGSGSGKSKSKSKKPGAESGKMKSMRQLQEQMNKQLQQLRENMAGQGKNDPKSQRQMSEQLARMAAQQEALRKQLQNYGQEMQKQGSGVDNNIKEMLKQMEQTETDLVNKRINAETLRRQQEIVTRMLESEKAEQQRELDEKRESKEAQDFSRNGMAKFQEYNKIRNKETELLRTVPPGFKPFYKSKVNAYFQSFDK